MADAELPVTTLDESMRRYYLDVMGIQSWQLLDTEKPQSQAHAVADSPAVRQEKVAGDMDVAAGPLSGNGEINWSQLEIKVQQCDRCPLHKTRKQSLVGRGDTSAEVMIVLLSPDAADDADGLLCSGEANVLLGKMLNAINISIDDVYITSLLKCAAPVHHTISAKEIHQCDQYLKQQIQLIQPKLLVVLGEAAVRCLLQKEKSLDDLRELLNSQIMDDRSVQHRFESVPLFVSYSPQELVQQPDNKRKAWLDLQQLQKLINGG